MAVGFNSGIFCGFNVNHVDISPNHAGILMGITNGISNIFGIVAPLLVQFLVTNEVRISKNKLHVDAKSHRFCDDDLQMNYILG